MHIADVTKWVSYFDILIPLCDISMCSGQLLSPGFAILKF